MVVRPLCHIDFEKERKVRKMPKPDDEKNTEKNDEKEPTNTDVVKDVDADTSDVTNDVQKSNSVDEQRLDKLESDISKVFGKVNEISDALGALVVNGGASVVDNDTTGSDTIDGFERKPNLDLTITD
jgi:hypothetical protein